jgi:hypothetical protein
MAESFLDGEEEDGGLELEASQKVSLAKWFLLNSPPEQIQQVAQGNFLLSLLIGAHFTMPSSLWHCLHLLPIRSVLIRVVRVSTPASFTRCCRECRAVQRPIVW